MKSKIFETENYIIKLINIEHAQMMCDYYFLNKAHFKQWEPKRDAKFYSIDYWHDHINTVNNLHINKQALNLIVLNRSTPQVIASCNFSNIVYGCFFACHLGFSIDKHFEGKGIMYDIIKVSIQHVHKELKLHRIMANHLPNNLRSEKLLAKLGFKKEGYAKSYLKINGQWQDHVLNSLILPSE